MLFMSDMEKLLERAFQCVVLARNEAPSLGFHATGQIVMRLLNKSMDEQ
jgi:hypothetical protein